MSVYIKGMEMPEHCGYCRFRYDGICHVLRKTRYSPDECPLIPVPNHGRLIDANAMQEEWYRLNFDRKISDGTLAYWNMRLSEMPTIIPADKEENNEKN